MASRFNNIMDMLQLAFAFVNAPLFATFLLGMFWKRATGHGAFTGLLAGTLAAAFQHALTLPALLFSIFGLLLVGCGAFSNKMIYQRSLGININLWWGSRLLVFGAMMVVLGSCGRKPTGT